MLVDMQAWAHDGSPCGPADMQPLMHIDKAASAASLRPAAGRWARQNVVCQVAILHIASGCPSAKVSSCQAWQH